MKLKLQITETIPEDIEEGILYVSLTYWTTAHKCGCGCGQKVVLRLSPKHWAITLNGEAVSMYPSVGNWQLPCRSHYWIEEGRIIHARRWSDTTIMRNRAMTKGRRTPFQTPRSRLNEYSQPEDSSDFLTRRGTPDRGNGVGGDTGELEGSAIAPGSRAGDGKKGVSTRWWDRTSNLIRRPWQKATSWIGGSRDS